MEDMLRPALQPIAKRVAEDPEMLARVLAGNFSLVNDILGSVSLELDISGLETVLVPKAAELITLDFVTVALAVFFYFLEDTATCYNLSLNELKISGTRGSRYRELPITWDVELGFEYDKYLELFGVSMETWLLELFIGQVSVRCDLPVWVMNDLDHPIEPGADFTNPHNLDDVRNSVPRGTLSIITSDVDFRASTSLRSKGNWTYNGEGTMPSLPPRSAATPGLNCRQRVVFNDLTFECNEMGFVVSPLEAFQIDALDLDVRVCEALNSDQRQIAEEPVQELLCDLVRTVSDGLGDFLADNDFNKIPNLNFSYSRDDVTYLLLPPKEDRVDLEAALAPERSLPPADELVLVDIGDNLLVELVGAFPEESRYLSGEDPAESILTDLYDFLTDIEIVDGIDPVFNILDEFLGTTFVGDFSESQSSSVDVLKVAEELFGIEAVSSVEGFKTNITFDGVDDKELINLSLTFRNMNLTVTSRSDAPIFERNYLDRLYLLGQQTILIPAIEGFDLRLDFDLDVNLNFTGGENLLEGYPDPNDPLDILLLAIYPFELKENLNVVATWANFFFETSTVVAIDETAVRNLSVGPLVENILDCLMSTFYFTPTLTSAVLNGDDFNVEVSNGVDTLTVFVQDALAAIVPVFRGVIPGLLEQLLKDEFVNQEIIEPFECPSVEPDDGSLFDFRGSVMDTVQDFLTQETVSTAVDLLFAKGTGVHEDFNQLISPESPLQLLNLDDLPSENGLNITMELVISRIEVKGISPANFTAFQLLRVNDESPNSLFNEIGLGVPIEFGVELELNTYPDRSFEDRRLDESRRAWSDADEKYGAILEDWLVDVLGEEGRDLHMIGVDESDMAQAKRKSRITAQASDAANNALFNDMELFRTLQGDDQTSYPTLSPNTQTPTTSPETPRPTRPEPTQAPTPLPPGAQRNKMRLDLSFENVHVFIDLLLKFKTYDVMSHKLNDILEVWCWLGKLQPYGGVNDVGAELVGGKMNLTCVDCTNSILKGLEERFNNPTASTEFFVLVNEILDFAEQILTDFFKEDAWDRTLTDINRWCQGLDSLESDLTFDPIQEDLSETYGFLGGAVVVLAALGFTSCCCINSTHEHGEVKRKGKPQVTKTPEETARKELEFLELHHKLDHIAHELEHIPLFRHPDVPGFWQYMIPFLLVSNLGLFIIGHIGQAVSTSVIAAIAGAPIELEDFQSISVLQSVTAVWNSGGYFLAILIVVVSVVWPYVKILGMGIGWFCPTRFLSFHSRGTLIKRLDQLGKWSLIELYLLLFILITFRVAIDSPENEFLPEGFYLLRLEIDPQLSIYTFATALILSLFTSNVIEWYQEVVEKKIATVNRRPQKNDELRFSVTEFLFPTQVAEGEAEKSLGFTNLGIALLVFGILVSIILVLAAAMLPVIQTEVFGIIRLAYDLERKDVVEQYSLFRFFSIILGNSAGEIYLGVFFLATVAIVPVLQLLCLLKMLIGRFTLNSAIFWYDVNVMLSAWACSEVFVMGVGVTVMELGQVSGSLARGECEFLQPFMFNQLVSVGLVTELDVQASCFTLTGSVSTGMYVLFLAVIIANIVHYAITISFLRYIQARLDIREGSPRKGPVVGSMQKMFLGAGCLYHNSTSTQVAV